MKLNVIALAVAVSIAGIGYAQADSVTVKSGTSGVVIKESNNPDVVVRKRVTVGSGDCTTKKVTRENELTDRKVTKTTKRCD